MNTLFQITVLTVSIAIPAQSFGMAAFACKWASQATERYQRANSCKRATSAHCNYTAAKPTQDQIDAQKAFLEAQTKFNQVQAQFEQVSAEQKAPIIASMMSMQAAMLFFSPQISLLLAAAIPGAIGCYKYYQAKKQLSHSTTTFNEAALRYAIARTNAQ